MLCGMDEANSSHLKYAASPTEHVLHGPVNSVKLALRWPWLPTILAKKLNGTLFHNIFRQIYHFDESKQLTMINQRLEFTKRQRTIFKFFFWLNANWQPY